VGRGTLRHQAHDGHRLRAGRLPRSSTGSPRSAPQTFVFNLETGYQFKETLDLRDRIAKRYGMEISLERPETTVEEYERLHGGPLDRTDSNRCCNDRGDRAVHQAGADQVRRALDERHPPRPEPRPRRQRRSWAGIGKFGVVEISPLANWTKAKVWDAIIKEDIPDNPLHDQGYVSIGRWPWTRAIGADEDERAGRWSGSASKTECGLHSRDSMKRSAKTEHAASIAVLELARRWHADEPVRIRGRDLRIAWVCPRGFLGTDPPPARRRPASPAAPAAWAAAIELARPAGGDHTRRHRRGPSTQPEEPPMSRTPHSRTLAALRTAWTDAADAEAYGPARSRLFAELVDPHTARDRGGRLPHMTT